MQRTPKTQAEKTQLFESARVPRAVLSLSLPSILSQLISLIYSMADTFFVGQLGDPNQVAAVSLAAPMLLVLTALANLFGIGAASTASRFMGAKDYDSAKRVTAFGFYTSLAIAVLLSILAFIFSDFLMGILGATADTKDFTRGYLFWVFVLGGAPLLLSMVLSHFVRADGSPKTAGFGLSLGGVLSLILNPIMIFDFGFGLGVVGAAIGTFLANMVTLVFFLRYFVVNRKSVIVSIDPRWYTLKRGIAGEALLIGLPGMLQTLLAAVSNAALNQLAKEHGSEVVAAIGVAKRIDNLPMSVTIGFAQGVMPLLAYNYTAKNNQRLKSASRFALTLAVGFSILCVAVFMLFPSSLVGIFIRESVTVSRGIYFLRVMCVSTPLMAVGFHMITLFQAAGQSRPALVLSVLRKGLVDIPLMFLFNMVYPLFGLAFVQPATEFVAMAVAVIFYFRFVRRMARAN